MPSIGIMSLKSDILFELFALVGAADPPHALPWEDPGPLQYHIGWIRLTHVCRLWRTFLIDGMPSLWARSVCLLPTAHDTMLARARDVPLLLTTDVTGGMFLRLPSEHKLGDRLRDFAITHIAQARSLLANNTSVDWVPHLEGRHLPLLENIAVHQELPYGDEAPVVKLIPLDAPNLRHVRIHDIAVTFTSQSIRHLTLYGKKIFSYDNWMLLDVIRSQSSSLEYLELEMQPLYEVDWQSQAPIPISFKRLKDIHVYGNANSNLSRLIDLLDVPMPLEGQTYYVHIGLAGWERFVSALGHTLCQASFNALFLNDDSRQIVVSTSVTVDKPEDFPSGVVQAMMLEVEYRSSHECANSITAALLAPLDRTRIEQIIIGYDMPDEKINDSRDTLRSFEAVKSFAARSHNAMKVLRVTDDNPVPIFPRLSFLIATMEGKRNDNNWDVASLRAWWDTLCGAVEDRLQAGVPITRIRITYNATPIPATDALRKVDAERLARVKELVPEFEDTRKLFESA